MAYTYRVYLAFEVPSEPDAFSEVTERMMQDALQRAFPLLRSTEVEVLGVDKVCAIVGCDRAPESGSDLCAGCHDSAGERQDERNAS